MIPSPIISVINPAKQFVLRAKPQACLPLQRWENSQNSLHLSAQQWKRILAGVRSLVL
jgi:hypothetical protein